jgi:flagellar capping protein FliD
LLRTSIRSLRRGIWVCSSIKLSGESTYRDATFSGNIITGNSAFDENGDPVYPENGLRLSVDLSQSGTFNATVRVKQGFAGALEDALTKMLATTNGSIQIDQQQASDMLKQISDKIDSENTRLSEKEDRLVARFARLEKTLALLQQQMAALGMKTA